MASSSALADQSSGQPSSLGQDSNRNVRINGEKPGEFNTNVSSSAVMLRYNFFKLSEQEGKVQCNICQHPKLLTYKDGSTTGLKKHLKQHKEELEIYEGIQAGLSNSNSKKKDSLTQTKLQSTASNELCLQFRDPKIQERFNKATVLFVAERHLTFQQAEGLGPVVESLFPKGQSKVKPLNRKQIASETKKFCEEMRDDLSKIFKYLSQECSCFAFTSDLWTSPSNESFMGFSLHCIDRKFNFFTFIPFVQVFKEHHRGVHIKIKLEEFVKVSYYISADQSSGQLFRGNI